MMFPPKEFLCGAQHKHWPMAVNERRRCGRPRNYAVDGNRRIHLYNRDAAQHFAASCSNGARASCALMIERIHMRV
jgi:hypothetical protein